MKAGRGKPKGLPKSGGRKAGTPNVATASFREKLEKLEFDISAEAVTLFRDPTTSTDIKYKLLVFLSEYTLSKPLPLPPSATPPSPTPEAKLSSEELEAAVGS